MFPACLQECVCVRHAQDCSLPPPPTHSEQLQCPEGWLWKWPPSTPSPGCTEHPGICRASLNLRKAIKPFPAGHKAPACLRPTPPSFESCTFTSVWDFQHEETWERWNASSIFKTHSQALCLFWPPSPMLLNHLLVPKWTPCRAQKLIIYGENGFLPPWDPIPAGPLPAFFRRTKVLPPQRPSQAAPHSAALQSPAPLAHNGSFKATSASVKRDTTPATEKLQLIKPAIRRKRRRRRRTHRGEGTKRKKYFILKPPQQHSKKAPCPSAGAGQSGLSPGLCRPLRGRYCLKRGYPAVPSFIQDHKGLRRRALGKGLPGGGTGKREQDEKEKQHNLSQRGQKSSRLIDLMILFRSQHNKANSFLWQFKTSFHRILYHANTSAERKGSIWAGLPADKAAVSFGQSISPHSNGSQENRKRLVNVQFCFILICRAQSLFLWLFLNPS